MSRPATSSALTTTFPQCPPPPASAKHRKSSFRRYARLVRSSVAAPSAYLLFPAAATRTQKREGDRLKAGTLRSDGLTPLEWSQE